MELKNEIENIDNCELKNNATQIVFADGNSESKVMVIGEGPGQKEDEQGKPFVGDAGLLLNKMLEAIQIKRNNIYITNVLTIDHQITESLNLQKLIDIRIFFENIFQLLILKF